MSIEYVENNQVYYCTKCKHHYYIPLNTPRPKKCDFCDNIDPWLYNNAIVELIYDNGDRKTVRYTGQKIKTKYCVRGTPWEFIPYDVQEIIIDRNGCVKYYCRSQLSFESMIWNSCPEKLKNPEIKLHRPEWIKYLLGGVK